MHQIKMYFRNALQFQQKIGRKKRNCQGKKKR